MKQTFKTTERKCLELIKIYSDLKDELLDYTEEYHDSMHWDIVGFYESLDEGDFYIEELENQIKAVQNLINGLKKLNFTFC
jgi:hypothetical protein